MFENCDLNHSLYIDWFQIGCYYIYRRQDSNQAGHLTNEN